MTIDSAGVQELKMHSRFTRRDSPLPPLLQNLDGQKIFHIQKEILSKAVNGVIMIDLDRNILNNEYEIENEPVLTTRINNLQDKGYMVCLNSSRSVGRLREWQKRVGTQCPIFAENGYVVDFYDPKNPQNTDFQIINDEKAIAFNNELTRQLQGKEFVIVMEKKGFKDVGVVLCKDEEPEDYIAQYAHREQKLSHHYVVPVNGWNQAKIVAFAKEQVDGKLQTNPQFQEAVTEAIKEMAKAIPHRFEPEVTKYPVKAPDDGSILCYATPLNKTQIWKIMVSYLKLSGVDISSPHFHLFHMGDGNEDNIDDERVTVYSPSNAKVQIIERKQQMPDKTFISSKKYTNGLLEGLNDIYEKTCADTV